MRRSAQRKPAMPLADSILTTRAPRCRLGRRQAKRPTMDRREFLQSAAAAAAAWSCAPGIALAQRASSGLWHERPLRIYHPNPREFELSTLDVKRFVADCQATQAEAVVISVGGVYAFYPSAVKYHHVSKVVGDRDLVGEI